MARWSQYRTQKAANASNRDVRYRDVQQSDGMKHTSIAYLWAENKVNRTRHTIFQTHMHR